MGMFYTGVAVVKGLHRLIPKWLMWSGLVLGICAMLSTFHPAHLEGSSVFIFRSADFLGMVWILAIACSLPHPSRGELHNVRP